jgi:hypothetical protein
VSGCPLLLCNRGCPDGCPCFHVLISVWCQGALSCFAIEGALTVALVLISGWWQGDLSCGAVEGAQGVGVRVEFWVLGVRVQ